MINGQTGRTHGSGDALLLAAGLLAAGFLLDRLAGGPRVPTSLPDGAAVMATLTGSSIPYAALGAFSTTLAWALWLWLTGTLVLQLVLAMADAATSGARWVRSLRRVIDPLTLPAVRRLAHGTAIAFTVAQLAARSVPAAAAAPAPAVAAHSTLATDSQVQARSRPALQETNATYTVRSGDTLWALAERFYGDGEQWPRIVTANVGRRMPDGVLFPRNPVLQRGWVLRIPDVRPEAVARNAVTYVVQPGDDLRIIAQRFYGDEMAWPRIYDANRGVRSPDGLALTNPDMIWSGMTLTIPGAAPVQQVPSAPMTPPAHQVPASAEHSAKTAPSAPPKAAHPLLPVTPPVQTPPAPAPTAAINTRPAALSVPRPHQTAAPAVPRVIQVVPTALPAPAPQLPHAGPTTASPTGPALGLAALAALGAGGTILLARRQRREPGLPGDRDAGIPIRAGFADPAHAPTFAHRLYGGGEPALLVAEQVQHVLTAEGLDAMRILVVREGRHTMTLTVAGPLTERRRLVGLQGTLADRLGAHVKTRQTADHDVTIQLARLGPLRLVAPPSGDIAAPLALVALGVLPTREALHVNWLEVGNLLIAGTPGAATSTVLTSILTGITARRHPSALRVVIVAAPDTLPAPLHALPHLARPIVDQRDRAEMLTLLDELTADLDRRASGAPQPSLELLLVLTEVTTAPEEALLPLLERGPAHGIHVLGATSRPGATDDAFLRAMHSVLALQLPDEDQSVRLVGTPDAGTLDNGELLARIEGRAPVRLRAFKVDDRHLERLVEQMRAVFRVDAPRPPTAPEPAPVDETPEAPGPSGYDETAAAGGASRQDRGTPPASLDAGSSPLQAPAAIGVAARQDAADTERSPLPLDASPATAASEGEALAFDKEAVDLEAPTPVATKSPLLCIRCFGPLQVLAGERELACMQQYQAWELLAYLATHGASVTRQEIFDTFWPGVEDAVAGNRLDNLVHRLKRVLTSQAGGGARDILCREQGRLALHGAVIDADVQRFDALLKRLPQQSPEHAMATMEAALALAGDDLLADADYGWLEQPGEDGLTLRERYAEQVAKLTHDLACRYRDGGAVDRAVNLFQQLLAAQPTLQPAARGLYRCYALRKDRQGLEQAHALLVEALREAHDAAGTSGTEFQLHPKTVAAYRQASEETQV